MITVITPNGSDVPVTAPGWPTPSVGVEGQLTRTDSTPVSYQDVTEDGPDSQSADPSTDVGEQLFQLKTNNGQLNFMWKFGLQIPCTNLGLQFQNPICVLLWWFV